MAKKDNPFCLACIISVPKVTSAFLDKVCLITLFDYVDEAKRLCNDLIFLINEDQIINLFPDFRELKRWIFFFFFLEEIMKVRHDNA